MRQRSFFDAEFSADMAAKRTPPRDPNVDAKDKRRLTSQNAAILERLMAGPATNAELAEISLKYTSRVSDLRAAGHTIQCRRVTGGVTTYELK